MIENYRGKEKKMLIIQGGGHYEERNKKDIK